MKTSLRLCSALVVGMIGVGSATSSQAALVTWEAQGVLTSIDRSGGLITEFASATVGTAFTARYTFETTTAFTSSLAGGNGGILYNWLSAIQSSELIIGGETLGRATTSTLLRLRDNYAGSLNYPLLDTVAVDGITFSSNVTSAASDGSAAYSIIFRGPQDLNLYSGPTLPEDPSPILTLLTLSDLQFLDSGNCEGDSGCQTSLFNGRVNSVTRLNRVSVAEPGTVALLGLGLLGIGFLQRRRLLANR